MEKAMKIKIALSLIFVIALSGAGINCGSSKADKITGPSSSGSPSIAGNALDIWSKSKIGVGETATITTKIFNTDGSVLSGGGAYGTTGTATTISIVYSVNTFGTLSAASQSASLAGSTTTASPETTDAYYFYSTLTGAKSGTAAITATRFEMEKTIYVDVE
jgi:hypothetical protein